MKFYQWKFQWAKALAACLCCFFFPLSVIKSLFFRIWWWMDFLKTLSLNANFNLHLKLVCLKKSEVKNKLVIHLICYGFIYLFKKLCDMFLCLLSALPFSHAVYFLWSPKNRCIIETWTVLLWKWKLECSHTGFYSLAKCRTPKFPSKVRIILHAMFEIILFFTSTFSGKKIA